MDDLNISKEDFYRAIADGSGHTYELYGAIAQGGKVIVMEKHPTKPLFKNNIERSWLP